MPRPALIGGPILVAVITLGGCGTTMLDPKSGENLIRSYVTSRSTALSVKTVSCPKGLSVKPGTSFDCQVDLVETGSGEEHKGTITVHQLGKRVGILGARDLHIR